MILFTAAPFLLGHGVTVTAEKRYPCVLVNARYHGSKALVNASVTIRFQTEKKEFQKGNTDKNGNFCFYPDQTGKWTVTVDDLLGHRERKEIQIDNDFLTPSSKENEIKPDDAEAHSLLGACYLLDGNRGSAFEQYKILKNLNKDFANELFNFIYR